MTRNHQSKARTKRCDHKLVFSPHLIVSDIDGKLRPSVVLSNVNSHVFKRRVCTELLFKWEHKTFRLSGRLLYK